MFYAYMLASGRNGTLYTGSTEDLLNRVEQHRTKTYPGFTARYGVERLVWFEVHPSREAAFRRERQIKEWRRGWKLLLIEAENPRWVDLGEGLEQRLADLEMHALRDETPAHVPASPLI